MFRARLVSAAAVMLVSLASFGLTVGFAQETDDCIATPKFPVPAGSHWHYRTDSATHKKCWHLDSDPSSSATPEVRPETPAANSQPTFHPEHSRAAQIPPAPLSLQAPNSPSPIQPPQFSGSPAVVFPPAGSIAAPFNQDGSLGALWPPIRKATGWPDTLPSVDTSPAQVTTPPAGSPLSLHPDASPATAVLEVPPSPDENAAPQSPAPAANLAEPPPSGQSAHGPQSAEPIALAPGSHAQTTPPQIAPASSATVMTSRPTSAETLGPKSKPQIRSLLLGAARRAVLLGLVGIFAVGLLMAALAVRRAMHRLVELAWTWTPSPLWTRGGFERLTPVATSSAVGSLRPNNGIARHGKHAVYEQWAEPSVEQ